jgi:hypothetical protein
MKHTENTEPAPECASTSKLQAYYQVAAICFCSLALGLLSGVLQVAYL